MRILLTVEYDGTAYSGWQRQKNGLAVQEVIESALSRILETEVKITGASRTDAGVHAKGQRFHFDTSARIPPDRYPFVLNTELPPDIRVTEGRMVPDLFHARFLSSRKQYTYRIYNRRHASALHRLYSVHVPVTLDVEKMQSACQTLIGTHDFRAFQAVGGTAKTTIRTIYACQIEKDGDMLILTIEGNAFLYNMVRIIAGTLIQIGQGKLPVRAFETALSSGSRLDLGPTAPACGLELTTVGYPPTAFTSPELLRWHTE